MDPFPLTFLYYSCFYYNGTRQARVSVLLLRAHEGKILYVVCTEKRDLATSVSHSSQIAADLLSRVVPTLPSLARHNKCKVDRSTSQEKQLESRVI